jgi:hypothetical protein
LSGRVVDEADGGRRLSNLQSNTATALGRQVSCESLSGSLGRTVDEFDAGYNGSAGLPSLPPTSQTSSTARYRPDHDSQLLNSSTLVESHTMSNSNSNSNSNNGTREDCVVMALR